MSWKVHIQDTIKLFLLVKYWSSAELSIITWFRIVELTFLIFCSYNLFLIQYFTKINNFMVSRIWTFMTLVLFIFVNLVFFCPKMILCIKIEISRNDFYNSLGFYFHNPTESVTTKQHWASAQCSWIGPFWRSPRPWLVLETRLGQLRPCSPPVSSLYCSDRFPWRGRKEWSCTCPSRQDWLLCREES